MNKLYSREINLDESCRRIVASNCRSLIVEMITSLQLFVLIIMAYYPSGIIRLPSHLDRVENQLKGLKTHIYAR